MSTTYDESELGHTIASTRRFSAFIKKYWVAFQDRRQRKRLQAALHGLSDYELQDIGIARDQIEYVASNPSIDPRGI